MLKIIALMILSSFCLSHAQTRLSDAQSFQQFFGTQEYLKLERVQENLKNIKIAILDNGFGDFKEREAGAYLPDNTVLVEDYPQEMIQKFQINPEHPGNPLQIDSHGLRMAQLTYGLMSSQNNSAQFYLLNSNGITNFRRAVRYAIEEGIDIILFSQNWEYGGNFDGQGFVNSIVNQATSAGIIWVNAAGNYGGSVYSGKIEFTSEGQALFSTEKGISEDLVFENRLDEAEVTITLSWTDEIEHIDSRAQKDLGLEIINEQGEQVAVVDLAQIKFEEDERRPSQLPREQETIRLDRGKYKVRVYYQGGEFLETDSLRICIYNERESIQFNDASRKNEIMVPADNPNVITIGDNSPASALGPTLDGRSKPDFILPIATRAKFTNGLLSSGSSNSAAIFAGIVAVLKAENPQLTSQAIKDLQKRALSSYAKKLEEYHFPSALISRLAVIDRDAYIESKLFMRADGRKIIYYPSQRVVSTRVLFRYLPETMKQNNASLDQLRFYIRVHSNGVLEDAILIHGGQQILGPEWIEIDLGHLPGNELALAEGKKGKQVYIWQTPILGK